MIVLIFSVAAVALFVVGLSLTLMIKGHHIDGEIATNRNMQALGIACAVHGGGGSEPRRNGLRKTGGGGGSDAVHGGEPGAECAEVCAVCSGGECSAGRVG